MHDSREHAARFDEIGAARVTVHLRMRAIQLIDVPEMNEQVPNVIPPSDVVDRDDQLGVAEIITSAILAKQTLTRLVHGFDRRHKDSALERRSIDSEKGGRDGWRSLHDL